MAKNQIIKNLTTGLPPWAKGVATLAILGGVVYAVYKVSSVTSGLKDKLKEGSEIKTLEEQGQKRNYTYTQYKAIADKFDTWSSDTINPFDLGNEDALWWLAKSIKSDLDFIEIEKAFGERYPHYSVVKMPLISYISYQYDEDEVVEANKILTQNKVTRKF